MIILWFLLAVDAGVTASLVRLTLRLTFLLTWTNGVDRASPVVSRDGKLGTSFMLRSPFAGLTVPVVIAVGARTGTGLVSLDHALALRDTLSVLFNSDDSRTWFVVVVLTIDGALNASALLKLKLAFVRAVSVGVGFVLVFVLVLAMESFFLYVER